MAGPSMVASLPALLIVGAHVIGNVTFPTPRKSPGSGTAAHFTSRRVRRLDANPMRKHMRRECLTILNLYSCLSGKLANGLRDQEAGASWIVEFTHTRRCFCR